MKPKTLIQKMVVELSGQLPSITEQQRQYAIDHSFEKWGVVSRNKVICLECSHTWKEGIISSNSEDKRKCPECGGALKMYQFNSAVYKEIEYFGIITVKSGYQVVRIISASKFMKKGSVPTYHIKEVMQHWIDGKGNTTVMSLGVQGFSQAYDQWSFNTDLEVREETPRSILRAKLNPWKIYPERKILPIIKRNGFKSGLYGIAPQVLFNKLLTDSTTEYLLKSNQISILKYHLSNSFSGIQKYLGSIKICTRNNYIIKDFDIWKDYVDLLVFFNKDLRNPKYVCPSDLKLAHDRLVSKKRIIQKRKKLDEMRLEIDAAQLHYMAQKKMFFGLEFASKNITVKVIESVRDFMEEGDELNHCLFTNEYYKKPDSLVLSARIKSKPIETVEVSLTDLKIIQARGQGNKVTKHHNEIINLVNSNMNLIKSKIAV